MGMSSHDYEVKTDKTGDRYTCKRKNYRYIIYLFLSLSHIQIRDLSKDVISG